MQLVCVGKGSEEAGSTGVSGLMTPHSLGQCSGKGSGSWGSRDAVGTGKGNRAFRAVRCLCMLSPASWRTPKSLGKALCRTALGTGPKATPQGQASWCSAEGLRGPELTLREQQKQGSTLREGKPAVKGEGLGPTTQARQ